MTTTTRTRALAQVHFRKADLPAARVLVTDRGDIGMIAGPVGHAADRTHRYQQGEQRSRSFDPGYQPITARFHQRTGNERIAQPDPARDRQDGPAQDETQNVDCSDRTEDKRQRDSGDEQEDKQEHAAAGLGEGLDSTVEIDAIERLAGKYGHEEKSVFRDAQDQPRKAAGQLCRADQPRSFSVHIERKDPSPLQKARNK